MPVNDIEIHLEDGSQCSLRRKTVVSQCSYSSKAVIRRSVMDVLRTYSPPVVSEYAPEEATSPSDYDWWESPSFSITI